MATDVGAATLDRRASTLDRALTRLGIRDDTTRIVAATPSLRASWLLAVLGVTSFAAWGADADPHLRSIVLILAPVLPVAGVAAAYGPWADPMYQMTQATPLSGFRVLLLRSIAALLAAAVLVGLVAIALPHMGIAAVAWVLPALALCSSSLMLTTFMPLLRATVLVSGAWLTLAVMVSLRAPATTIFRGWGQLCFFAVTVVSSLVLARRRQHLEIANLHTRRSLVDAADAERRRIERNLHDGAQQQLVAIGVKAGLARVLVKRDPDKAIGLIDQVCADAQAALASLRDMTRGAYPPILADEGLPAALAAKARSAPLPVTLDAAGIGRLPKSVEIATYFCCTEAMQNAAKHAKASSIAVTLRPQVGALVFSVVDDGEGFELSAVRRGVGMRSMAERVESLGGSLDVRSELGVGTTVTATIPLTDAPER
ncbi:MAG: sensor histidine kinase [Actinomycetota bacterium]